MDNWNWVIYMNIFIHYLDKELLDIYCSSTKYSISVFEKVCLSIKVALLLLEDSDHIYIPVSNYFESNFARDVLEQFRDIRDLDYIRMVSSSSSLSSFIEKKIEVYPSLYSKEQLMEEKEKILVTNIPGTWGSRLSSATKDIVVDWRGSINDTFWEDLYKLCKYKKVSIFENALADIPFKIRNQVFVVDHVIPELKIDPAHGNEAKEFINRIISRFYIKSFLEEYKAVCFKNIFLFPQESDLLPSGYSHIDYADICRKLTRISYNNSSLYEYISHCNNIQLMLLKERFNLLDYIPKKIISIKKEKKEMKPFIIHGHDNEVKLELKDYLQNTLKMDEPIVLADQSSGGLTIMEKFEKYSAECNLVFVLLTPDDKYTTDSKSRSRQNVIFEMGYFLGKLGRKSGRVILLYKGELELPSDIEGVIYIRIDNGISAAGELIRKELKDIKESL